MPVKRIIALLVLTAPQLAGQSAPPHFLYVYRDSLRDGVDSAYRVIEEHAARMCVDFKCPNPYIALESLKDPHEVWWINAFATEADTVRVGNAYAANRPLLDSLAAVQQRKATMVGTPVQGYVVYRPDLSRSPGWSLAGARFVVVMTTRNHALADGPVWEGKDSTLYILRPVTSRQEADSLALLGAARVFAIRPYWSMPAPEWVAADPDFWRLLPATANQCQVSGVEPVDTSWRQVRAAGFTFCVPGSWRASHPGKDRLDSRAWKGQEGSITWNTGKPKSLWGPDVRVVDTVVFTITGGVHGRPQPAYTEPPKLPPQGTQDLCRKPTNTPFLIGTVSVMVSQTKCEGMWTFTAWSTEPAMYVQGETHSGEGAKLLISLIETIRFTQ